MDIFQVLQNDEYLKMMQAVQAVTVTREQEIMHGLLDTVSGALKGHSRLAG